MFLRKLKAQAHIYFIRTQDESGRDAHYFIRVEPAREAAFRRAMKGSAMVDYASFGEIVARDFGHVPSPSTIALLKRDYDYDYSA